MLTMRVCGHSDVNRYYPMMEVDFDSEELMSKLSLHKALMNGSAELLAFTDEQTQLEMGYALVLTRNIYGYVLLKYFGIFPWYRDKGMGVEAMRLINRRYAEKQGIIAELTEFEDPDPDHLRKLFKFFTRFGYSEIDADYRISGTKAHVFVKPLKGTGELSAAIHRIIPDFYSNILSVAGRNKMLDIRRMTK